MNRIKKLSALFAFSLMILGLPLLASAQWRDDRNRDCDDDYYGQDDRGYGNASYNRNLRSTVERLKNRSKDFEKRISREVDNNGYRNDNYIEDIAENFKRAADELEDEFGNGRNLNNSADEARQLIRLGQQLDNELYRARLSYSLENDWNAIRNDLSTIGNAYGYSFNTNRNNRNNRGWGNGGNNRNGNGNSNGGWRNRVPFPLPF